MNKSAEIIIENAEYLREYMGIDVIGSDIERNARALAATCERLRAYARHLEQEVCEDVTEDTCDAVTRVQRREFGVTLDMETTHDQRPAHHPQRRPVRRGTARGSSAL